MSTGPPGFDSVFSIAKLNSISGVEFSFAIEIYPANSIRYLDSTAMHDRIINGARSGLFIRNITIADLSVSTYEWD